MNKTLFGQFESWALELQDLSHKLRRDGATIDAGELDEQVQSYREILKGVSAADWSTRTSVPSALPPARRCIDLLSRGCIETNGHGIIQRANRAASRLLNIPLPFMTGQPLLVFIQDDDRRAFLSNFMMLRHNQPASRHHCLVRCKPLYEEPFLASFIGERVADVTQDVIGLLWLFSKTDPMLSDSRRP
jgi:PAS domain-containing protein